VGCADLTQGEVDQLVAAGCVLFSDIQGLVPVASRVQLEALGVDPDLVQRAATVRELLREAAQSPDDTFERLETRVISDRIRREGG